MTSSTPPPHPSPPLQEFSVLWTENCSPVNTFNSFMLNLSLGPFQTFDKKATTMQSLTLMAFSMSKTKIPNVKVCATSGRPNTNHSLDFLLLFFVSQKQDFCRLVEIVQGRQFFCKIICAHFAGSGPTQKLCFLD